jgi:cytochrome c oxidase cbb3-type subunit 3
VKQPRTAVALVAVTLVLVACQREQRRFSEVAPASGTPGSAAPAHRQGGAPVEGSGNAPHPYENNAWAVSQGKQLYHKYNCVGCHANGGGGMGPPLMDGAWIYGSSAEDIHRTIAEGRPNGMPAFGDKVPDEQIWKMAAYVRSMSGLLSKDVSPNRDDHMQVKPAEQSTPRQTPCSPHSRRLVPRRRGSPVSGGSSSTWWRSSSCSSSGSCCWRWSDPGTAARACPCPCPI